MSESDDDALRVLLRADRRVTRLAEVMSRVRLAVIGCLVLGACVGPAKRFAREQRDHRHALLEKYPPGSPWREPADGLGNWSTWSVEDPAPDGRAEIALQWVVASGARVVACHHGAVLRSTFGPSAGPFAAGFGAFKDYVFVDADGRVVAAFRHWMD